MCGGKEVRERVGWRGRRFEKGGKEGRDKYGRDWGQMVNDMT